MRVLVIGGAGYIGSHVVKEFIKNGDDVTVFDNLSTGQKINLFDKASFVEGDILDYPKILKAMQGKDVVIHLAAKKAVGESMTNPQIYSENNITGSINILNAMTEANVKNIVFSSSATLYGIPEYFPIDEKHPVNVINYYGFTKYAVEQLMSWYNVTKDINYMSLRYFNAVGYDKDGDIKGREKNSQNLLPIIMEVVNGQRDKLTVFGADYDTRDGTCVRDYIHVSDLAKAHVLAAKNLMEKKQSHILNLGTSKGTTVKEIITAVEEVVGKKINVQYVGRRAGDPAVLIASSEKAKEVLGWEPKYLDIKEIIRTEV